MCVNITDTNTEKSCSVPLQVTRKALLYSAIHMNAARCNHSARNNSGCGRRAMRAHRLAADQNMPVCSVTDKLRNHTRHSSAPSFAYCELATGSIKERPGGMPIKSHSILCHGWSSKVREANTCNNSECFKTRCREGVRHGHQESNTEVGGIKEKLDMMQRMLDEEKLMRYAACDARDTAMCASLRKKEEASRLRVMLCETNERLNALLEHSHRITLLSTTMSSLPASSEHKTDHKLFSTAAPPMTNYTYLSEETVPVDRRSKRPNTCPSASSVHWASARQALHRKYTKGVATNKFTAHSKSQEQVFSSYDNHDIKPLTKERRPLSGYVHDSDLLRALQRAEYRVHHLEEMLRNTPDNARPSLRSLKPAAELDRKSDCAASHLYDEDSIECLPISPYTPFTKNLTII